MGSEAWSNQVRNKVIIGGTGGGLFVYSGNPALGNLISSDVAAAGFDQYGNAVLEGNTGYDVVLGTYLAKNISILGLAYYTAASGAGPWTLVARVFWETQAPNAGLTLFNQAAATTLVVGGGQIEAFQPIVSATALGAETWHSLGTLAGYTVNTGRYRLTPEGETELDINVTSLGANAANVNFSVTLPAAYTPSLQQVYPLGSTGVVAAGNVWPHLQVGTGGVVTVQQTANNAVQLGNNVNVPLN